MEAGLWKYSPALYKGHGIEEGEEGEKSDEEKLIIPKVYDNLAIHGIDICNDAHDARGNSEGQWERSLE